jgi:hypothetical protein
MDFSVGRPERPDLLRPKVRQHMLRISKSLTAEWLDFVRATSGARISLLAKSETPNVAPARRVASVIALTKRNAVFASTARTKQIAIRFWCALQLQNLNVIGLRG